MTAVRAYFSMPHSNPPQNIYSIPVYPLPEIQVKQSPLNLEDAVY
jgi:hypothetical protein